MNIVIKTILKKITDFGFEAYLVGGYPRDTYLGLKTNDYDITTNATPKQLKKIFPKANFSNAKYGSITIKNLDYFIEITTYRKEEEYLLHRFPQKITYVKTLNEDLLRRDFTINTLCMNEHGEYIDLLGARNDLEKKIIRVVGNTHNKIEQDSLRILRAIRFASNLHFRLDLDLQEAIKHYKNNIKELSYFRKKQELDRIFIGPNADYGISLLSNLEEPLEVYGLEKLNLNTSILGIWAQLDFSPKYEFSRNERKEIEKIRQLLKEDLYDPFILYTYGHYYCSVAAEIRNMSKNKILELYQNLPIHHRTEIAINVKELEILVSREMIGSVFEDLEIQILKGSLDNVKLLLKKYIIKKYRRRKN